MPLTQPLGLPGTYTVATLPAAADNARLLAWATDRPGGAGYMISNGTSWSSASGPLVNTARATTAVAGTYTWTYPTAYPVGVIPNVQALVQAASGTTDVLNIQLDGAPTNTQAVFRVTRTQQSVVALLGLTILSIPASIGAQVIHLRAEA